MSAEYELGRAMRTANRNNDYRQRTQEAAAMIGLPETDPRGYSNPSYEAIQEARAVAANSMGHLRERFSIGNFARGLFGDQWQGALSAPVHHRPVARYARSASVYESRIHRRQAV